MTVQDLSFGQRFKINSTDATHYKRGAYNSKSGLAICPQFMDTTGKETGANIYLRLYADVIKY